MQAPGEQNAAPLAGAHTRTMGSSAPPAAQHNVAADDGSAGLQARVDQASKALSDSLAASSGQNSTITTDQLLAEFKNHTQAVVAKSQAVMTQQLGETVHQLVERLDQSNQLQFGQQNQRLNTPAISGSAAD